MIAAITRLLPVPVGDSTTQFLESCIHLVINSITRYYTGYGVKGKSNYVCLEMEYKEIYL